MQEAAAWAGPRFQLTHSAAKGPRERAVLCADCGVLLEDSETQLPSVVPGSVSKAADRKEGLLQPSYFLCLQEATWEWHPDTWNGNVYTATSARGSELPKVPSSLYLPI